MRTTPDPFNDLVITFRPDATAEEEDRFLSELAFAILAVARHVVMSEPLRPDKDEELGTIDF
jgi:hypothetical protein